MKTALQATIDAMGALTLLNYAMNKHGIEDFPFIRYEVVFRGEGNPQPQVWVFRLGDQLAEYSFTSGGVIITRPCVSETEPEEIDYAFYNNLNNLNQMNKGRALEDFDMHTKALDE